jgi:hypothetical protein
MVHLVLDLGAQAGRAVGRDRQPRERVGGDRVALRLQLLPGDRTVVVRVDPDRIFEVTQGDVPLDIDHRILDAQRQIAVARLVCCCRQGEKEDCEEKDPAHSITLPLAARAPRA